MERLVSRESIKVFTLLIVVVMPLLLGACGANEPDSLNISGRWNMLYATKGTTGEQGPDLFTFGAAGHSPHNITGYTAKSQAIVGQITGLDILFSFVDSDGATNTSTGTVSAADSAMSGTWTKSNGQSGTWHAVIALAPQVDIAGKWNMFSTTSGGTEEQGLGLFKFTQSGNSVKGTTSDGKAIVGAIGLWDICFFWVGSDGITYTFAATITVDGATMSGTWSDTSGKSGTWRATKG